MDWDFDDEGSAVEALCACALELLVAGHDGFRVSLFELVEESEEYEPIAVLWA